MSFSINLGQSPEKNAKALMQERLDNCREALQDQRHPHKAIHQARKELKKIRAVCRLVRDEVGEEAYKAANYYFRNIARKLSDARDASAVLETLYSLEKSLTTQKQQALLRKIKYHFGAHKAALTRLRIHKKQLLQEVYEDLKNAEMQFTSWKFEHDDFQAFHPGIKRVYKRCRKGLKNAYEKGTPEGFHEWRKRVKYFRYQMDMLTPVYPGFFSVLESELHKLSDFLGDDHDLSVFMSKVTEMKIDSSQELQKLYQYIGEEQEKWRQLARPLGNKLFYMKPSQMNGWLETCWNNREALPLEMAEESILA